VHSSTGASAVGDIASAVGYEMQHPNAACGGE
jgi:hypothetical protein